MDSCKRQYLLLTLLVSILIVAVAKGHQSIVSDRVNRNELKKNANEASDGDDIENALDTQFKLIAAQDGCECINYSCGCCQHLQEQTIHLNSTICANVTYLSEDIGISLTVTVDDYAIFNETVSVRNPPPVCLGVPYVKEWAEACVRFHDVVASSHHLHACAKVEARMKHILIAQYELGCFDIGPVHRESGYQTKQHLENEIPSVMLV